MDNETELNVIREGLKDAMLRLPSIEAQPTTTSALLFWCAVGRACEAAEKLYYNIKNPPPAKPVIQRRKLNQSSTEKKSEGFF